MIHPTNHAANRASRVLNELQLVCRQKGLLLSADLLIVHIASQSMDWFQEIGAPHNGGPGNHSLLRRFLISTSRFGIGQEAGSNKTPLGLHRIAQKIGGGDPIGTVFRSRRAIGFTWAGQPDATIAHRILWLEGLEPGLNRGGNRDTFQRYIYIHGVGDETTLGRPASCGCIHVAGKDLIPLFDRLPVGTLVWIGEK